MLEQSSGLMLGAAYEASKGLLQTQSGLARAGQTRRPPGSRYKTTGSSRGCGGPETRSAQCYTDVAGPAMGKTGLCAARSSSFPKEARNQDFRIKSPDFQHIILVRFILC